MTDTSRTLIGAVVLVLSAGCVSELPAVKAYEGPERGLTDVVFLKDTMFETGQLELVEHDGRVVFDARRDNPGYQHQGVMLRPGTYRLYYGEQCYKQSPQSRTDDVELIAGHTYELKGDCCVTTCAMTTGDYRTFLWIEDSASGAVIAGSKSTPVNDDYAGVFRWWRERKNQKTQSTPADQK